MERDTLLPYALFAYLEVPHQETGFTPFDLLYGYPIRKSTEVIKEFMAGEELRNTNVNQRLQDISERKY